MPDIQRRLQPNRDGFLPDIQVAEPTDQPKAVELPRFLLEPADEQHLPVKFEHLVLRRLETHRFGRAGSSGSGLSGGGFGQGAMPFTDGSLKPLL